MKDQLRNARANTDALLRDILHVTRAGHAFFVSAYPGLVDAEVRTAFAYVTDVKARMIAELTPWLTAADDECSAKAHTIEKMYTDARAAFHGRAPANVASALGFGEDQLLRMVERAFADARLPALRQLLKTHHSQLRVCRQAMGRMQGRMAA